MASHQLLPPSVCHSQIKSGVDSFPPLEFELLWLLWPVDTTEGSQALERTGSFCFSSLGMLTLGIFPVGTQPPCCEKPGPPGHGKATCRCCSWQPTWAPSWWPSSAVSDMDEQSWIFQTIQAPGDCSLSQHYLEHKNHPPGTSLVVQW